MASLGQSTPSTRTRDSDLPDPCNEKRELRRMVQELEAENERLREAIQSCLNSHLVSLPPGINQRLIDALDGGGDSDG